MTDVFTNANRVKLYYCVIDCLPAHENDSSLASLPTLEDGLKRVLGLLELGHDYDIGERIKSFILNAPEDKLLTLIEMIPGAHYSTKMERYGGNSYTSMGRWTERDAEREATNIAKNLNIFLEDVLDHPARFVFEPEWEFRRDGVAMQKVTTADALPKRPELINDLKRLFADKALAAVMFIDLDHFKRVNDTQGHDVGNVCLEKAVEVMSRAILKKGKLYRVGGDEFVVLLPNFTPAEAEGTAERIRSGVDSNNPGGTVKVTTSIGVVSSESTDDAEELIKAADDAMYVSKQRRNCVTVA